MPPHTARGTARASGVDRRPSGRVVASAAPRVARAAASLAASPGILVAPPMVYAKGEEMTRYVMSLVLNRWVTPHIDTKHWQYFDLSCKARDDSNDEVLRECVKAGLNVKSIFKEPTITPTEEQVQELGLKKRLPSPNGTMRRGWNGITISRSTIHIPGVKLGYAKQVRAHAAHEHTHVHARTHAHKLRQTGD